MTDTVLEDLESELVVVGELILAKPPEARSIFAILRDTDFRFPSSRFLFQAARDVLERDGAIDSALVRSEIAARNGHTPKTASADLLTAMSAAVSTANLKLHAKALAKLRALDDIQTASRRIGYAASPTGRETAKLALADAEARLQQVEEWRDEAETPAPTEEVWDLAEALTRDPPDPPEELVEGLITRPSVNLIFGPPSSGKSWAAMHLAILAAYGAGNYLGNPDTPVFPHRTTDGAIDERVLWIFGSEDNQRRIELRLRRLISADPVSGWAPARGVFSYKTPVPGLHLGTKDGREWVTRLLDKTKPTILALDTIASLTGDAIDSYDPKDVVPFMGWLHELRDSRQLTILGLHHTRKEAPDGKKSSASKADTMLGTQAWRSMADSCMMIDAKDGDTDDVTCRLVKSKDIDRPTKPFHSGFRDGVWSFLRYDADEDPSKPKKIQKGSPDHILSLRSDYPDGLPMSKVWTILSCSRSVWMAKKDRTISELLKLGHTQVAGTLRWAVDPGEKF